MISDDEVDNYEALRDAVSELIISKSTTRNPRKRATKGRKNEIKPVVQPGEQSSADAEELSEFIEYIAVEIFLSMPSELRGLSYTALQNDPVLGATYALPLATPVYDSLITTLSPSVPETLTTYALLPPSIDLARLLEPVYASYITHVTLAPPEHAPSSQRASECEICEREHLPLTYHHLFPRQVHAKAVKRGWAKEWEVDKVAWLCRACHSFVHKIASNEELAKEWNSVERLMEREDVIAWAKWVGRVRWKAR